jgi:hypothetical protein
VASDPVAGVALQAASELTKDASSLVLRMFGPMADEIGEHLQFKVHGYLERNRTAAMNRAAEMIRESGRAAHTVPLRTALPLLRGAATESDESLQEKWAALLANAATSDDDTVPPVFASILSNLSPAAARAIAMLANRTRPQQGARHVDTFAERGGIQPESLAHLLEPTPEFSDASSAIAAERRALAIADILVREGLAALNPTFRYRSEVLRGEGLVLEVGEMQLRITQLGLEFLDACTAPGPKRDEASRAD